VGAGAEALAEPDAGTAVLSVEGAALASGLGAEPPSGGLVVASAAVASALGVLGGASDEPHPTEVIAAVIARPKKLQRACIGREA